MKVRKALAIICYTVCLAAYGAAGYVSYIAWNKTISYYLGFLIFLPVWIVTYWFSTFFVQLSEKKLSNGKTQWIIGRKAVKILNWITCLCSIILLCFWAYVYISQYLMTSGLFS